MCSWGASATTPDGADSGPKSVEPAAERPTEPGTDGPLRGLVHANREWDLTSFPVGRWTRRAGLVLAAALLLEPAAAAAQSVPSPFRRIETGQEAGLFAGVVNAGTGRFGYGPGSGFVTGARYGVELSGPISLEGVVSALSMTRDVIDPELAEGARVAGEADALLVKTDLRFKFSLTGRRTWHGFSPHLLVGGGFVLDVASDQEADQRILEQDRFDFGNKFTATAGTGLRFLPAERLMFRTDLVVDLWQLETPSGFAEVNRGFENVEDSEWANAFQITFGAAIRF